MDLTLYHCLLSQLPEPPDLAGLENRAPVPETWPLVLKSIETYRKQVQGFTVTDGKSTLTCRSSLAIVYEKVSLLELGQVVHLLGGMAVFDAKEEALCLTVQDIFTLKEYDEHLKEHRLAEEARVAKLREEGFFDAFKEAASQWDACSTR